jgi:myosin heavy chain 9/10/11/14
LRIVDLETKSYSRNPQSSSAATIRRLESRIEELTNQLIQVTKDHRRTSLSSEFSAHLMESERQREKLEGEVRLYEDKVNRMRLQMDDMVSTLVGDVTGFRGADVDVISKQPRASCN